MTGGDGTTGGDGVADGVDPGDLLDVVVEGVDEAVELSDDLGAVGEVGAVVVVSRVRY